MQLFAYIAIYVAVAVLDVCIAHTVLQKNREAARMLAYCLYCSALVALLYLVSIVVNNSAIAPVANILCLCVVDVMVLFLVRFFLAVALVELKSTPWALGVVRVFIALGTVDVISLLLNPIFGHVATYLYIGPEVIPHYSFEPYIPYLLHTLLCYFMLVFAFGVLFVQAFRTPRMYRVTYYRIIAFVFVLVGINAAYLLYFSQDSADFSILFYSLMGYALYFSVFIDSDKRVISNACQQILFASDQPTIIFDYRGRLLLANESACEIFPFKKDHTLWTFDAFYESLKLDNKSRFSDNKARFYWTPEDAKGNSYICDYHEITDKDDKRVARSFVFTNNIMSADSMTGFLTEQYFTLHQNELSDFDMSPVVVAVCDLNQLGLLNNVLGFARGNDAIAAQARIMQQHLPKRAIFVRLHDARLGAICYGMAAYDVKQHMAAINKDLGELTDFTMPLKMDYAVVELEQGETVVDAAARATSMLKTRKLLDKDSGHSNVIDSLTQMLIEIDSETEAHVRRTRILGDNLAFELGLSDYERDQLSLLCLFHDIGKVGVPLHILNKPGPLNDDERTIMHEHVKKGYRIARATAGLEIVAEPILHHHERWDGKGYPDGLQHEAIPILSRIISVVDSYDAMVSDRPYHKGIPIEAACQELVRCAGTQFDPYIVDAFVRMVGKKESAEEVVESSLKEIEAHGTTIEAGQEKTPEPSQVLMVTPIKYTRYVMDEAGKIISADDAFERLTGYTSYDIEHIGLTQNDLIFDDDRIPYWALVNGMLDASGLGYIEHRIRCKNGTGRYVYCIGWYSTDDSGKRCVVIVVTDITDSVSVQHQVGMARNRAMMSLRRLEENIQLDPLTSLLNQGAFRRNCERELLDAGQRFVLVMLDLDDFKEYNDTYGHPKGDELLVGFAKAFSEAAGTNSLVGRLGGDEFACLLKFKADASLSEITERLNIFWDTLKKSFAALDDIEGKPTFSAGADYTVPGHVDYGQLYKKADELLYEAKNTGKGLIRTSQSVD